MRPLSLRWRLLVAGGAAILVSLSVGIAGLAALFDRHVERVAVANLEARAQAVIAMVEPVAGGAPILRQAPRDPNYDQPFSGHYWQLRLGERTVRSRSLWDYAFPMAETARHGAQEVVSLTGPRGNQLLAIERHLLVGRGPEAVPMAVIVASERAELVNARRGFFRDLLPYAAAMAGLLLAAFVAQVMIGLRPLSRIAARITDLSLGKRARLGGDLPSEVMPLARQLDLLLDDRDREMARARHRAADLAHGFKTPLQALMGDAGELRRLGQARIADNVESVAKTMHRLVSRELARARIQSDRASATCDAAAVVDRVVRVLQRVPAGRRMDWQITVCDNAIARMDGDDLTEAVGALLENAVRHAVSGVRIEMSRTAKMIHIEISDDGPGIPEEDLARLMQRGERLDSSDGQGIGLAIVSDILDAAGGRLSMINAPAGLKVTVSIPGAD